MNRWTEYFEESPNRPAPQEPPDTQPADTNMPIDHGVPTKEEIHRAIRQVRNSKSTGPGSSPAEAPKADMETNVEPPHPFLSQIWEEQQIPPEWNEGNCTKLPRKGDLSSSSSYRGIMPISIPGKVSYRILLNRMKDIVDPQLRDQQASFRGDSSRTD